MIANLKPYPVMKDSGIPWLGEVPEHWEVRPLCAVGSPKSITGQQHLQLLSVYLDRGVIRFSEAEEKRTNVTSEDLTKYQVVAPGDFVLNNQQAWRGSVGVSNYCGIVSPAYLVLSLSHKLISSFANLLFRDQVMVTQYVVCSRGVGTIQRNLYWPHLRRAVCPLPPLPEQTAIVRYLDHADRRIRRYIRAKQKLITLLEEQKQAIIHQAVTGQIDVRTGRPYPAYKDSGVEWLGRVPEDWEVRRVKSLSLVKRGASPRPIADPKYFDGYGDYAWVRIADVTASSRYLERTTQWLSVLGQSLSVPLEPGALFLSIAGSVGKPIITRIKCCIHDGFVYFPQFTGNVEFLCRIFASGAPFARLGKLGTQLNLNTDTVGNISLGWPPSEEQAAIVSFLDRATTDLDAATTSTQRETSLLREYHTRLIADVVTGKLDVRDAAAGLPEVDPLADEFDGLTTQAAETGMLDLEDATETPEEFEMENEATV